MCIEGTLVFMLKKHLKNRRTMQKEKLIKYKYLIIVFLFICTGILYFLSTLEKDKNSAVLYQLNETVEVNNVTEESDTESDVPETRLEAPTTVKMICIHVCGEVVLPGIYEVEQGSRLWDAIESAGGLTESAAADYINLAQIILDGEKIVVPSINEVDGYPKSEKDKNQTQASSNSLVNINTASLEELKTLSGIGQSRAESIISYRENNGPFAKIEDIMKISGIKEAAFEKIKNHIVVE